MKRLFAIEPAPDCRDVSMESIDILRHDVALIQIAHEYTRISGDKQFSVRKLKKMFGIVPESGSTKGKPKKRKAMRSSLEEYWRPPKDRSPLCDDVIDMLERVEPPTLLGRTYVPQRFLDVGTTLKLGPRNSRLWLAMSAASPAEAVSACRAISLDLEFYCEGEAAIRVWRAARLFTHHSFGGVVHLPVELMQLLARHHPLHALALAMLDARLAYFHAFWNPTDPDRLYTASMVYEMLADKNVIAALNNFAMSQDDITANIGWPSLDTMRQSCWFDLRDVARRVDDLTSSRWVTETRPGGGSYGRRVDEAKVGCESERTHWLRCYHSLRYRACLNDDLRHALPTLFAE